MAFLMDLGDIEQLTEDNYYWWSRDMRDVLVVQDWVSCIEERGDRTLDSATHQRVASLLRLKCSQSIRVVLKDIEDPYDIWAKLEKELGQPSPSKLASLRDEFRNVEQMPDESIYCYYARCMALYHQIVDMDPTEFSDPGMVAEHMLQGLSPEWTDTKELLLKDQISSLRGLLGQLLHYERCMKTSQGHDCFKNSMFVM